ncbi:MAG: peroxiredoxin [Candidatus Binatia bacterium]
MNRPTRTSSASPAQTSILASLVLTVLAAGTACAAMLAPGAPMPEFALADQNGAIVRSQDLVGQSYLLWYYPKAMTPGCTKEAQGLRDRFAEFKTAGVEVLGVSFDKPDANRRFVEAEALPFRLLSDADRKLAIAVGAADSDSAWVAKRISYLVGPDGKIRKAYDNVDPSNHAATVLKDSSAATHAPPKP